VRRVFFAPGRWRLDEKITDELCSSGPFFFCDFDFLIVRPQKKKKTKKKQKKDTPKKKNQKK